MSRRRPISSRYSRPDRNGIQIRLFRHVAELVPERDQIVADVAAVVFDAARRGLDEAGNHAQRRRLAGSVRSEVADDLAWRSVKSTFLTAIDAGEVFRERARAELRHRPRPAVVIAGARSGQQQARTGPNDSTAMPMASANGPQWRPRNVPASGATRTIRKA